MYKYDRYRSFIHPLIALVLPASFLISAVLLSAELYSAVFDASPALMQILYLVLPLLSLLSGLSAVMLGNIFQVERVSWSARLREFIILVLIVYTGASLFRTGPLLERFLPYFPNILPVLYAAGQWYCSVWIQNSLRDREFLLMDLEGKEGTALYTSLRDMGPQAEEALKALRRLRTVATSFALVLFALLIPQGSMKLQLSIPSIVSIITFFILFPYILALSSQYNFEQYAAGAGLRELDTQRNARLRYALAIIVFLGAAAYLVRGQSAIIPLAWLLYLLQILSDWFNRRMPGGDYSAQFESTPEVPFEQIELLPPAPETSLDLRFILDALNRLAPVALAVLLVLFLLAPLLSKKYRIMLARHSIKDFLKKLRKLLCQWFGKQDGTEEDGVRLDPDNMSEVRKRLQELGENNKSRLKRKEFGRVSRAFIRLIRWGRRYDIVFTASSAPGSYTQKLADRFPERTQLLKNVADCFEQAVYSPYPLGKEKLHEYEESIKTIVQHQ